MFNAIYSGLSGLTAFSKGLDVISDNVSNLNTPGYKGNDLIFQDIFYRYQLNSGADGYSLGANMGGGVDASVTKLRLSQGDIRSTDVATDVAIDGNGFFVIRKGDEIFYTRGGQFEFNDDGILVARGDENQIVMGLDENGKLRQIDINALRTSPPKATSNISFKNVLSTATETHEIPDIEIFDVAGNKHKLKLILTHDEANNWIVEVKDDKDEVIATRGEIHFSGDGTPTEGFNTFTFEYKPENLEGNEITLNFGTPGSYSGVRSLSGAVDATNIEVDKVDGYDVGGLKEVTFEADGSMVLNYTNGNTEDFLSLALARVDNLGSLRQIGDNLFMVAESEQPVISAAAHNGLGDIVGKSIELSNVELTQQFTDLIVVQRGYQASSQILTVSNEMLQQLLETMNRK
ncbi:MAG: flagellar basal-body rod protein FlgF [Gammaproteobacteria bacterium]|nr:flagellar basal-body rod protein FlgF [Gammaproteobacteria bacterium]MDH5800656.1 flagellar basal-body rod protein FlgF [Gammaproteobacteria bacterium]